MAHDAAGNLLPLMLSALIRELQQIYEKHGDMKTWVEVQHNTFDDTLIDGGPVSDGPRVLNKQKVRNGIGYWHDTPNEPVVVIFTDQG